jgi:hypothetical protein
VLDFQALVCASTRIKSKSSVASPWRPGSRAVHDAVNIFLEGDVVVDQ